jgi:hypothetical protein
LQLLRCFNQQGIETVRRDNCELVRKTVATSLDKILNASLRTLNLKAHLLLSMLRCDHQTGH